MSIIKADARHIPLIDGCVQTVVTSPPYFGLRDYGTARWVGGDATCPHRVPATGSTMNKGNNNREGTPFRDICGVCGAIREDAQIGLEPSPDAYVASLVAVFAEVWRVLKEDGTVWLNIGDSYANTPSGAGGQGKQWTNHGTVQMRGITKPIPDGLKPKDLIGIPWRCAMALQAWGWYLRSDIIWAKGNPMPESVTDRPTKSHEYIFLLSKSPSYYYDADAIREPHSHPDADLNTGDWKASVRDTGAAFALPAARAANRAVAMSRPKEYIGHANGRNKRSVWAVNTSPFTGWAQTSRRVRVSWDESDGDTTRTTSPDCPVHGDRAVQAAKALCGEHEADGLSRSGRTDSRPVLAPLLDSVPTDQPRADCSAAGTSDSSGLSHEPPATPRNSRSRRTARAPLTTSPCSVSEETSVDTGDTSTPRGTDDSAGHMPANSSAADSASGEPVITVDGTPLRIGDKCSCEYYKIITENTSHFATFPEKLIEPCILAGAPLGGLVFDPFCGSGTTIAVAQRLGRRGVGTDLSYQQLAQERTAQRGIPFSAA